MYTSKYKKLKTTQDQGTVTVYVQLLIGALTRDKAPHWNAISLSQLSKSLFYCTHAHTHTHTHTHCTQFHRLGYRL